MAAFSWAKLEKNPQKVLDSLSDDWRTWPPELQLLLHAELKRRRGLDVTKVFGLKLHEAQQRMVDESRRYLFAALNYREDIFADSLPKLY